MSSTAFPDESQISEHAKDAVCWCYENKIMTGYRDGSFGPKEYITRVQISAVLFNYDNVDHDKLFNIEINNIDKIIINREKSILGNNGYITEKNKATVYPDKQKEIIEKIINSLNSFDYVSKDTTSRDEWIYSIEIFEKDKEEPILNIKLAKTQVSITLDEVHFRVDHIFYISDTENKYIDVAWLDKVTEK